MRGGDPRDTAKRGAIGVRKGEAYTKMPSDSYLLLVVGLGMSTGPLQGSAFVMCSQTEFTNEASFVWFVCLFASITSVTGSFVNGPLL